MFSNMRKDVEFSKAVDSKKNILIFEFDGYKNHIFSVTL